MTSHSAFPDTDQSILGQIASIHVMNSMKDKSYQLLRDGDQRRCVWCLMLRSDGLDQCHGPFLNGPVPLWNDELLALLCGPEGAIMPAERSAAAVIGHVVYITEGRV